MRPLIVSGLTLAFGAVARAQTPPLVPAPPLAPLPAAPIPATDYPGATWRPAAPGNFDAAERPADKRIDTVVLHDIEGDAPAGITIFERMGAKVSAHYVVAEDGTVVQMVRENHIAWHAGNLDVNGRAIGIEAGGFAYRPGFYTPALLEAEARLVRDITTRYAISRDRTHIIGHAEVPDPADPTKFGGRSHHTDPGPYWDWPSFMTLVRNDATVVKLSAPTVIHPGEVLPASVMLKNLGDDAWPANTAPKPLEGLQASGPVVYLATSDAKPSPLFDANSWISPLAIAGTLTDVAPGGEATYTFSVVGPRQLGDLTAPLRLSTFPTVAQGGKSVAFGPLVPLQMRVEPYDITLQPDPPPPPDPPLTEEEKKRLIENLELRPQPIPPLATFTAKLPLGGIYGLYVSLPKLSQKQKNEVFAYQFYNTQGGATIAFRAYQLVGGSLFLGYYRMAEPTPNEPTIRISLKSSLSDLSHENLGTVRLVGPFPTLPPTPAQPAIYRTDGAVLPTENKTLPPTTK